MGTFPLIPVGFGSDWLIISSNKQGIYTLPTSLNQTNEAKFPFIHTVQ